MRCKRQEGCRRSERNQQEPDASSRRDDYIKTCRHVEAVVRQRQLRLIIQREEGRLGQGLPQDMKKSPQQDETR